MKRSDRQYSIIRYVALALVAVVVGWIGATACTVSRNPVSGKDRMMGYSWQQEIELGKEAHGEIQREFGFYTEGDVESYVRRVGQEVLQQSHLRRQDTEEQFRTTDFSFRVLDSDTPNAFALPGGYVYVTRGLVSRLNNEAQLAVILGHEIAHIAARHASQRAFEQQAGQIGLIAGAILGQEAMGWSAERVLQVGSQAAQVLFLKYSRDDERQSDELGVEYASLAGYEASEGAEFFRSLERISRREGQGLPTFLSTHPDPGNRQERILELAKQWSGRVETPRVRSQEYLSAIDRMVIGQNPRHGFVQEGVFYHPEFAFQFPIPAGFEVHNAAARVVMRHSDGQALLVFGYAREDSPQSAASEFASRHRLQIVAQRSLTSNGRPAHLMIADAESQQQQVRLLGFFVRHEGEVFQFVGYTPQQVFDQHRPEFERAARGFRLLREKSILNVEPLRINIQRASRSAPFQSFLQETSYKLAGLDAGDLAIMNQLQMDTPVERGHSLKLPVHSPAAY